MNQYIDQNIRLIIDEPLSKFIKDIKYMNDQNIFLANVFFLRICMPLQLTDMHFI